MIPRWWDFTGDFGIAHVQNKLKESLTWNEDTCLRVMALNGGKVSLEWILGRNSLLWEWWWGGGTGEQLINT